jgi:phosphoribosylanthranilate isomerase
MAFVKVCGLTSYDDAKVAAQAGADALGFVFYDPSPRAVKVEAGEWIRKLTGSVMKVGVFVNAKIEEIANVVARCDLDAVQLHGDETQHFVSGLKKSIHVKIIRAVRPAPGETVPLSAASGVNYLLLDRHSPGQYGGTGETSDWALARVLTSYPVPLILSGGLSPENVREACLQVKPFGVDASSSLESSPGSKDHDKVRRFVANAKTENTQS